MVKQAVLMEELVVVMEKPGVVVVVMENPVVVVVMPVVEQKPVEMNKKVEVEVNL